MSDFTATSPAENETNYFEYDPGPEAAEKAGNRDFSVPEGFYPMTVSKFERSQSKAGNAMWVIEFVDVIGTTKSRYPYKLYQVLGNDKSKANVSKLLSALGCERTATGGYKVDPSKFIGSTVDVYLVAESYEGTVRSKPKYIRAIKADSQAGVF